MSFIDVVLFGIVALLVVAAILWMRKNKGSHCKGCSGCSVGSGCDHGSCSGCDSRNEK